jgi:hypothetical protein
VPDRHRWPDRAVALLCRGAAIDRAIFVALDADPGRALAGADVFMKLYDSVPVQAPSGRCASGKCAWLLKAYL